MYIKLYIYKKLIYKRAGWLVPDIIPIKQKLNI